MNQKILLTLSLSCLRYFTPVVNCVTKHIPPTNNPYLKLDYHPRTINKAIIRFFSQSSRSHNDVETFRNFMQQRKSYLNQINVITLLHRCGKCNFDIFSLVEADVIFCKLNECQASAQGISNALYGLQNMKSSNLSVIEVLHAIELQLLQNKEVFTARAISSALYGLRGMDSSSTTVLSVLKLLNDKIRENKHLIMDPQGVGMSFIGIQKMSCDSIEMQNILESLSLCILKCPIGLDSQALANTLEGLKCCSCDSSSSSSSVIKVISALQYNLKTFHNELKSPLENMTSKELSMTLHGLQGISSDYVEVRIFLDTLCQVLKVCPILKYPHEKYIIPSWNPFDMGHLTENINNKKKNKESIEDLIQNSDIRNDSLQINNHINKYWSPLNAAELGTALFGLRKMSSHHVEVRRLLSLILVNDDIETHLLPSDNPASSSMKTDNNNDNHKVSYINSNSIPSRPFILDAVSVGSGLYGMHNMCTEYEEVRRLVGFFGHSLRANPVALSARALASALYGLRGCRADYPEVRILLQGLSKGASLSFVSRNEDNLIDSSSTSTQINSHFADYTPRHMAMALYGLQQFSGGDSVEEEDLIRVLASCIDGSPWPLRGQEAALALHGLQVKTSTYDILIIFMNSSQL